MMKVEAYRMVVASTSASLETDVNRYLELGYTPGHLQVVDTGLGPTFYQTMVRFAERPAPPGRSL